jgi:hypothetical protein
VHIVPPYDTPAGMSAVLDALDAHNVRTPSRSRPTDPSLTHGAHS